MDRLRFFFYRIKKAGQNQDIQMIKTDLDSDFSEVSKTVYIFQIRSFVIEILMDKVEASAQEIDLQRKTLVFTLIFN